MAVAAVTDSALLNRLSLVRKPREWLFRWYVVAFCFAPGAIATWVWIGHGTASAIVWAEWMLGIGTFLAFFFLSDRPLLNPVQGVVLIFHQWFGLGPPIVCAFTWLTGQMSIFHDYWSAPPMFIYLSAVGLPLFALAATATLSVWPQSSHARFLEPEGQTFKPRTIFVWFAIGLSVHVVIALLAKLGIETFSTVNFLGGQKTDNPFLAALASLSMLADQFAVFAFIHAWIVAPESIRKYRLLFVVGVLVLAGNAFLSGSKGNLVFIVGAPVVIWFNLRQRPPWTALVLMAAAYFLFLQPFIDTARYAAEDSAIKTNAQRQALFVRYFEMGNWSLARISQINSESPFRYIFHTLSQATPEVHAFSGPWGGYTLNVGLESLMPRFLDPTKPDMDVGNFAARDLGQATPDNFLHNESITVPYEFAVNYGWAWSLVAFIGLGPFFAIASAWLMGKDRMATHPLNAVYLVMLLQVEGALGAMLGEYKNFPIVLFALWMVWRMLGRRL